MSEDKKHFFDDQFIAQWVSGSLPREKQKKFEQWLRDNPQEQAYFETIRNIWHHEGNCTVKHRLTQQQRWQAISTKAHLPYANPTTFRRHKIAWRVASIAAVFVLLFATYFWMTSGGSMVHENTPRGKHQTVVLPCRSEITLNAESSISYNKNKWQKTREVFLEGEAFFKVRPGKIFTIQSNFVSTQVLGTTFNIKSRNNKVEISCVTGKVRVRSIHHEDSSVLLTPQFGCVVSPESPPKQPIAFDNKQKIGWLKKEFYFVSTPLHEVFDEIERQFDCPIHIQQPIKELRFTGSFDGKNVQRSIEMVCLSAGLNYRSQKDSSFTIY